MIVVGFISLSDSPFYYWWCSGIRDSLMGTIFKGSIDGKVMFMTFRCFLCLWGNRDSTAIGNEEIWNGETIFPSSVVDADLVNSTFQWADKFCIPVSLSFSADWTNNVKRRSDSLIFVFENVSFPESAVHILTLSVRRSRMDYLSGVWLFHILKFGLQSMALRVGTSFHRSLRV